jgi:hypothetical protein
MGLPGFNAEAALGRSGSYRGVAARGFPMPDAVPVAGPVLGQTIRCCQYVPMLGRFVCVSRVEPPWFQCRCIRSPAGPFIHCRPPVLYP